MSLTRKNTNIGIPVVIMALLSLFSFTACEEEKIAAQDEDIQSEQAVSDDALTDDLYEDMDKISMEAAVYAENGRMAENIWSSLTCASKTVERNHSTLKKKVILTFGEDCEDVHGRVRSGNMIVNYSIELNPLTYSVSTTFEDFFINGYQIEGTRTLTYSSDEDNSRSVNITLTDGKVTFIDGTTITRNGSFTRLIHGESGEVSLSGSAVGINRNGIPYVSEITEPLIYQASCMGEGIFMASSGKKMISRTGKKNVQLDFGEGICDRTLTLSADGVERILEITIN